MLQTFLLFFSLVYYDSCKITISLIFFECGSWFREKLQQRAYSAAKFKTRFRRQVTYFEAFLSLVYLWLIVQSELGVNLAEEAKTQNGFLWLRQL